MNNGKRSCDNVSLNGNFSRADLLKTVEGLGDELVIEILIK